MKPHELPRSELRGIKGKYKERSKQRGINPAEIKKTQMELPVSPSIFL
jgi:hypothetical protein